VKNGFFIEAGASDFEEYSNTLYFEVRLQLQRNIAFVILNLFSYELAKSLVILIF
jgi:hypothetical protein